MSNDNKVQSIIESVEQLSVLELSQLVTALEDKFGVVAAAPMVAAAPAAGGSTEQAPAEEKSEYTVVITNSGDKKINVIKAVREINPQLGLKEAKDMVDAPPANIAENVAKEKAEEAKKKLEEAGATVELQ
jgi:large subunit ribosomal protein L7/L12